MSQTIKNKVLPTLLRAIPLNLLGTLTGANPVVAYYHIVTDEDVSHVKHLFNFRSVAQFEKDLETFLKYYKPISLTDLIRAVKASQPVPPRAFLLTFDDGFRELKEIIAPVLIRKGIPATFFLTTAFLDNKQMALHNELSVLIEHVNRLPAKRHGEIMNFLSKHQLSGDDLPTRLLSITYGQNDLVGKIADFIECDLAGYLEQHRPYLTSTEVRELLADGFTIGAHSVDHPLYSALTLPEQLRQTNDSVGLLRQNFAIDYAAFSFPHGDSNVGVEFFNEIYARGALDVSFGSAGFLKERCPRHFQRFSPENSPFSADHVLRRNYGRSIYKKLLLRQVINRTQPRKVSSFETCSTGLAS